jgi:hypothetical protein
MCPKIILCPEGAEHRECRPLHGSNPCLATHPALQTGLLHYGLSAHRGLQHFSVASSVGSRAGFPIGWAHLPLDVVQHFLALGAEYGLGL